MRNSAIRFEGRLPKRGAELPVLQQQRDQRRNHRVLKVHARKELE
jgi:hypothetical protein